MAHVLGVDFRKELFTATGTFSLSFVRLETIFAQVSLSALAASDIQGLTTMGASTF